MIILHIIFLNSQCNLVFIVQVSFGDTSFSSDLRRVAVTEVATLLSLVEEGARRRRTAATKRNATSSRSHALLELATSRATLHLADLAGR